MKIEKRWIKSVLADAEACKTRMPWERGLRRQAMIHRRNTGPARLRPVLKHAVRAIGA